MKKRIWQWLIGICLFTAVVGGNTAHLRAHLDPPGPPAFQEVVWLVGVNVLNDMDNVQANDPGELWLDWLLVQPGHEGSNGRLPAAGWVPLQAPPATPFPAAYPVLLYNHLNCNPLERPLGVHLTLNDDDGAWGVETSQLALAVGAASGVFGAANAEFAFTIEVMVIPRPELNPLCDAEYIHPLEQPLPPPPPPPTTPPSAYTYLFEEGVVTVYGPDGTVLVETAVTGPARVHILPANIIIVDDDSVEIYDLLGTFLGNGTFITKPGFGVFLSHTSLWTEEDAVHIFTDTGQHLEPIPTNGRADILIGESIFVIDDQSVRFYSADASLLQTVNTNGRAQVYLNGDQLLILDAQTLQIFSQQGILLTFLPFPPGITIQVHLDLGRVILVGPDFVQILDRHGNLLRHINVLNGPPTVMVDGDRIIIIDDDSVEIYDRDGNLIRRITVLNPGDSRPTVMVDGDRIIIIDDDSVEIYDRDGNLIRRITVLNPGDSRPTVLVDGDRIIIIDDDSVEIYDRDGNLIRRITILNPGDSRPTVMVDGDRIIIIDDDSVEIYDRDGNLIRRISVLNTESGRPTVMVDGDRIIIIDDDSVEIYDRDGNLIRRISVLNPGSDGPTVRLEGNRIIIIDDDSVEIYDRDGNLMRRVHTDGRATIQVNGDRIIVIDDDSVEIYDRDGNLLRHVATNGRADIIAYENRTITADDSTVKMYNGDGLLLLNVPTPGRATITIQGETLLVITQDGQTTTYTLDLPPIPEFSIFLPVVIK
ncbi:MAG TPA: hypothetical protein PLD25_01185 [Chloroflexota bacterium]|nr:hypothetical protein [Chloroflexota bacterium]